MIIKNFFIGDFSDITWMKKQIFAFSIIFLFLGCVGNNKENRELGLPKEACIAVIGEKAKADCYIAIAEKSGEYTFCNKTIFGNETKQKEFEIICYFYAAMKQDNSFLCGKIEGIDNQNLCYTAYAVKYNNTLVCKEDMKETLDFTLNDSINACIQNVAISAKNITICKELDNDFLRQNCILYIKELLRVDV